MQQMVTRTGLVLGRKAVLLSCFPTARIGARIGQQTTAFTCNSLYLYDRTKLCKFDFTTVVQTDLGKTCRDLAKWEDSCIELAFRQFFIMPGIPLQQEQEAIAFLQKTPSANGGSFYDHVTDVVMKVSDLLYEQSYTLARW